MFTEGCLKNLVTIICLLLAAITIALVILTPGIPDEAWPLIGFIITGLVRVALGLQKNEDEEEKQ